MDRREEGATGTGPVKEDAEVAGAEANTAADIGAGSSSRAGEVFLLLEEEECDGSNGVFRPKDRPTADAPTTVAVAQS